MLFTVHDMAIKHSKLQQLQIKIQDQASLKILVSTQSLLIGLLTGAVINEISLENSQKPESNQLYGSVKLLIGTFPQDLTFYFKDTFSVMFIENSQELDNGNNIKGFQLTK